MANRSQGQGRQGRTGPAWQTAPAPLSAAGQDACAQAAAASQAVSGTPAYTEPEVRRWPHPVDGAPPVRQALAGQPSDALLHYIYCALSYQNQLLADIKALLEQLEADFTANAGEK